MSVVLINSLLKIRKIFGKLLCALFFLSAAVILHIVIISDSLCSEAIRNEVSSDKGAIILSTSPTPTTSGRVGYSGHGHLQNNDGSKKQTFPFNTENVHLDHRKLYDKRVTMKANLNLVLHPPKFKDLEEREGWNVVEQFTSGSISNTFHRKVKVHPETGRARRISKRANVYFEDVDMTDTSHDERIPDRNDDQVSTANHTNNVDVLVRNKTSQEPKRTTKMAGVDPRNSSALYKKARNLFHVGSDPPFVTKLREENDTEGWSVEKTPAASVDQGLDAAIVTAISLGAVVCVSLLGE